ncbi:MAG: hypothetical protein NZ921_03130 [Candidatus Caldarchaeum sp.]|nr:hypothetical protein [Candidatus Caldarchaeum sp.]MCS7133773.1 hypothetical protein [Candidatus Caldarchaeum sp.]MCX8200497.1 hypothetical protein [Candidatus Caldarchaeum sp.]MDW8436006.1 hypothetical protein [Candidatus Caldarchaeum sp.]
MVEGYGDDVRNWANAFILLLAVALSFFIMDMVFGFQLTPTFLFFSVYFPLLFTGIVFFVKLFRRVRR